METKNNLEDATASLPAETETYVNTKDAKGLHEEIITSSQHVLKSPASSEISFYSAANGKGCDILCGS